MIIQDAVTGQDIRTTSTTPMGALETCGVESLPVAVRSSATAEDLPTASFAGQQDTYLWIQGADQVVEKFSAAGPAFTPRAIDYRIKNDFPHEKVLISVGVQKMVNSKAAGVMFTLNPTDGDLSKVVIEGSWGLGETVVSGSVNPDKFVVDKIMMETTERTISTKHIECVYDPEKGKRSMRMWTKTCSANAAWKTRRSKGWSKWPKTSRSITAAPWTSSGPSTRTWDFRKTCLSSRPVRKPCGASARKNRFWERKAVISC